MEGELDASARESLRLNSGSSEDDIKSLLIRARIAIKKSNVDFDIDLLDPRRPADSFLKGEVCFVRGIYFMNTSASEKAAREFGEAEAHYHNTSDAKALLARYNYCIANLNHSGGDLPLLELLQDLNTLLEDPRIKEAPHVKAMVLRQKSYIAFDHGLYAKALQFGMNALEIFATTGPKSDLHLCCIQVADCHIECGDRTAAVEVLKKLPKNSDTRVEFARAYIHARLTGHGDMPATTTAPYYWKERWRKLIGEPHPIAQATWTLSDGWLINNEGRRIIKMRSLSLEGRLLTLLSKSPASKAVIISTLWPEFSSSDDLNLRFHQLIKRTNSKTFNGITFDGEKYQLSFRLTDS
jgi:tetratricopeptide (TPR) repeat protein